jgi:hypothetical protein
MKIFIQLYQSEGLGISKSDSIYIPSNKITVEKLKEILFEKFRINQSQQKLSVKIANKTIVIFINFIFYK